MSVPKKDFAVIMVLEKVTLISNNQPFTIYTLETTPLTSADLVLLNGNIITMNPKMPTAQAIAVKGDRIIHVGTNQETQQFISENTKTISLDGRTVTPGFIDTHTHVVDYGRMLTWLNLEGSSSIKEIQTLLTERVKKMGSGKWVLGRALNPDGLLEKRLPTRQELDMATPDNPVVFYCQSGQACVINSKALEAAKISQQNNPGIKRTLTGEPTGVLSDHATNLVWNVIPEPTEQELFEATKLALKKMVQYGITSIHWIVLSKAELPIIRQLVESGFLPLRVYLIVPVNLLDLAINLKQLENDQFKFGGAVIFSDGYLASRTAALLEPYSDNPTEKGKMLYPRNEMRTLANKIQAAGLQLIIHAVGDKAVTEALTVIQHANQNPVVPRPRIEQAAVLNQRLIQQIKEANISVSLQPCVVVSEFSVWSAAEHLGEKRVRWAFPVKDLLSCGVLVSAGSDCPMEPLNPLLGVKAAVKRDGMQNVTVFEALQMYTIFGAQASLELADKGSIEQGKLADLAVLSNDPAAVAVDELGKISVSLTILGGACICSKS
ncbi:MAG: amidohydrolase [Candidatus Bathyarchaeia archaeon]|jgi:predicted amidohydrolase YtcJ